MTDHSPNNSEYCQAPTRGLYFSLPTIGVGIGFLLGAMFERVGLLTAEVSYVSMVLICGGIGIVIAERMYNKK
jgi:hypothetical protein